MPKKKAPKAKISKSEKTLKSAPHKDSNRYLTVFLEKGRVRGDFFVTDTLDSATKSLPPKQPRKKAEKPQSESPFWQLQKKIIDRIAVHRSLDQTMSLLHTLNMEIQFRFQMEPILDKFAKLEYEQKDRRVFSFDRAEAREIVTSIRLARSGAKGIQELTKLLLTGLVSEYDVFLHDLISIGLSAQGDALATLNRTLTLKELLDFADIGEARDFLIEREIDAILYEDHRDQLAAISKLFNLKIDGDDSCVKTFLEICERRNLFAHNAGVVNRKYLNKCKQLGLNIGQVKLGDQLRVNRKYFTSAIDTIQEISIKLIQFIWRKLKPDERDLADDALNDVALELLVGDEYKLAERILDYGINQTGASSDLMRRMMIVNYANAVKLGGDKARSESVLSKYDWSATNSAFQMSVAAVRDDINEVVRLMPKAVKSDNVSEEDLRRWPVFKNMRIEKLFQDKYREIFGKDLISVAGTASKATMKSTNPIESQMDQTPIEASTRNSKSDTPTKH